MSAELKAKMVASSLTDEDATRDAEWEEVWYVSSGYRFATVHLVVGEEIRQKEDTNPIKAETVLFDIGSRQLTGFQVLKVLWLMGEGGPGMAEVGDEVAVDEAWVNHADSAGVL